MGLRRAPSGDLLGYKLARPGDVTAAGEPVFYSGSKLAPDLSLPRCSSAGGMDRRRWAGVRRGWERRGRCSGARVRLRRPGTGGQARIPPESRYGAGDVVVAVAGLDGAPRWWGETAELGERAGRIGGAQVEYGPVSLDLRRAARGLLAHHGSAAADDAAGMLALAVALAALLVEIGRWRKAQHRPHQAVAAHAAAAFWPGMNAECANATDSSRSTLWHPREVPQTP